MHALAKEGVVELRSKDGEAIYDSANTDPDLEWMRPMMDEKFSGNPVKIIASGGFQQHVSSKDCYLFCTGLKYDWSTIDEDDYNACIRIDDTMSFMGNILPHIPGIGPGFHYGKVAYYPKTSLGVNYPDYHAALVKDPRYEHQKEFRFMIEPVDSSQEIKPIFIEARGARKYCTFFGL